MDNLSDELLENVLGWITPTVLLKSVSSTSPRFARLTRSIEFWRRYPLCSQTDLASLKIKQLQMCAIYIECRKCGGVVPSYLRYGPILATRSQALFARRRGRRACLASTTDHVNEEIENVLNNDNDEEQDDEDSVVNDENASEQERHRRWLASVRRGRWWSSSPSRTQDTEETLLFTTRYPLTLIDTVEIRPLRDPYQFLHTEEHSIYYTWHNSIIQIYNVPLDRFTDGDRHPNETGYPCTVSIPEDQDRTSREAVELDFIRGTSITTQSNYLVTIDSLLAGVEPVYESEPYIVPARSNQTIIYPLPPNTVGNVIVIKLAGKNVEQRTGMGYYACVESVQCKGFPLVCRDDYHPPQNVPSVPPSRLMALFFGLRS